MNPKSKYLQQKAKALNLLEDIPGILRSYGYLTSAREVEKVMEILREDRSLRVILAEERERCAKICDGFSRHRINYADYAARDIRALEDPVCWACKGTKVVTTSSNGSGLIEETCMACTDYVPEDLG